MSDCISPDTLLYDFCQLNGICSELALFDAHGEALQIIQGTKERLAPGGPVQNVELINNRGSGGCYIIFEEENFKGAHICLEKGVQGLKNAFYNASVVR